MNEVRIGGSPPIKGTLGFTMLNSNIIDKNKRPVYDKVALYS